MRNGFTCRATEVPSVTSAGPQTRGFLFADLRGYTRFAERHGDAAAGELIGRCRSGGATSGGS
jgi:class 3 adenylate cyclase